MMFAVFLAFCIGLVSSFHVNDADFQLERPGKQNMSNYLCLRSVKLFSEIFSITTESRNGECRTAF